MHRRRRARRGETREQAVRRSAADLAEATLREFEADLARINRISMMGELAASLAHEIKQPITGVAINALGNLSSVVNPTVIGAIRESTGDFNGGLLWLAAMSLVAMIALAITLAVWKPARRHPAPATENGVRA